VRNLLGFGGGGGGRGVKEERVCVGVFILTKPPPFIRKKHVGLRRDTALVDTRLTKRPYWSENGGEDLPSVHAPTRTAWVASHVKQSTHKLQVDWGKANVILWFKHSAEVKKKRKKKSGNGSKSGCMPRFGSIDDAFWEPIIQWRASMVMEFLSEQASCWDDNDGDDSESVCMPRLVVCANKKLYGL
jgi:hypothetical protein